MRTAVQNEYSISLIEGNNYHELNEATIRKHVKVYLILKLGNVCSICGITEWCGKPVPLVCDHIDGDHTNNDLSNYRLACCNCDALLPTYKSKNRGKGRKCDREYYSAYKTRVTNKS